MRWPPQFCRFCRRLDKPRYLVASVSLLFPIRRNRVDAAGNHLKEQLRQYYRNGMKAFCGLMSHEMTLEQLLWSLKY